MEKPTFSIIIPTYNRVALLARALNSLYGQTYDKNLFEIIVVDDGSTDQTQQAMHDLWETRSRPQDPVFIVHRLQENKGRINARNIGMELASKEWICWLDSDDEYCSTYLEIYARAIEANPGTDIFTGGTIMYDEQNLQSRLRDGFMPGVRDDGRGCLPFKSGGVSTGGFVFRTRLAGGLHIPGQARVPYGSADSFPAVATQVYPELATLYGQNPEGQWLPFGNPWGDDWLAFYLLTRENVPIKLNIHPYIQHVRHG